MTDEQIEAAARAIHLWDNDDLPAEHLFWDEVPPRIKERRRQQATAALAAAEAMAQEAQIKRLRAALEEIRDIARASERVEFYAMLADRALNDTHADPVQADHLDRISKLL